MIRPAFERLALFTVLGVLTLYGLLSCTRPAPASGCYAAPAAVTYQAAAPVYQAAYAVSYIPIQVPTYSVGYTGGETAALKDELKALREELRALRQPQPSPPVQVPQPLPQPQQTFAPQPTLVQPPPQQLPPPDKVDGKQVSYLQVFAGRCASCHDKATAAEKGGGFVMTEGGKLAQLDIRGVLRIVDRSYNGTMPPQKAGGPLNDQEVGAVMAWVSSLK